MFLILSRSCSGPSASAHCSKRNDDRWRTARDGRFFVGGFVPALVLGVAVGNVLQGVPLPLRRRAPRHLRRDDASSELLNPFALLAGLLSVAMLAAHGAAWLS